MLASGAVGADAPGGGELANITARAVTGSIRPGRRGLASGAAGADAPGGSELSRGTVGAVTGSIRPGRGGFSSRAIRTCG